MLERRRRAAHELELLAQSRDAVGADRLGELRAAQALHAAHVREPAPVATLIKERAVLGEVIDAAKRTPHPDRPGHRHARDVEHALDVVEKLDRLTAVAVELVHEAHDRRRAQPADFHELDRARLDALRRVDDHQRAVHRGERAIGVLGKVFVTRRVEQIDQRAGVRKLHHRGGDRDAALLLEPHPIRRRVPARLAPLDRPRHLNRAAEQEQLLGQRGLARVGMRNDRKRPPFQVFVHRERDRA